MLSRPGAVRDRREYHIPRSVLGFPQVCRHIQPQHHLDTIGGVLD